MQLKFKSILFKSCSSHREVVKRNTESQLRTGIYISTPTGVCIEKSDGPLQQVDEKRRSLILNVANISTPHLSHPLI